MKNCDVNNRFNCSPYIKFIFVALILAMAMMSCKQEVRVDNDDFFSSAVMLVENDFFSKVIDRNTSKLISDDMFFNTPEKIQSKISKVYTYKDDLYFILKSENKIKVYKKNDYTFVTEYDFNNIGQIEDITFPNSSNFYVSLSDKGQVVVVDRENKKISQFLINVNSNPTKLYAIGSYVYVACENSIDVIRTGTKSVEKSIELEGRPNLISTNLNNDVLLVFTKENITYQMNIIDISTLSVTNKVSLESTLISETEEMIFNQIAIVNNSAEYSWLGTSIGLFRIDLRNLGTYKFMSSRLENIKNVYFEPISDKIIILSNRNQQNEYILANSRTGEYNDIFLLSDNTNLIYPL